jgi:hypothetical protein
MESNEAGPSTGKRSESASVHPSAAANGGAAARDRWLGFSILSVAFVGALGISWKSSRAVRPSVADPPAPPTSAGVEGFPERVDPVSSLELAESLTERRQLRRLVATGVASDGTVDVRRADASISYEFDSKRGEGPQPPRPAGTVPRGVYCGRQTVKIGKDGVYAEPDHPTARCTPEVGDALPEPRCAPERVWRAAIERGAPRDGKAVIEYYRAVEGPAWRFSIPGTPLRFVLYGDCERELKGEAARNKG